MKKVFVILVGLFLMLTLSGCYLNEDVKTNQIGLQLNRNAVVNVVGPGVYSDAGWFADLKTVDVDTLTFQVTDPEVLTQDNQVTGVMITIQARRNAGRDAMMNLVTNWASLLDNTNLINTISATAKEGIKNGTRLFTLTTLLDDRNGLATAIKEQVQKDSDKYNVEIINVTIENIAIDPNYTAVLNEKALLRVQTEKELQRRELITQEASNRMLETEQNNLVLLKQLETTKAQTAIDVEVAKREGLKIAAINDIYKSNPQAFELERLRLMQGIFGDKTVFMFPQGTDLSLFLNTQNAGMPVIPVTPQ